MDKYIENINAMLKLYDDLNNGEIKEIRISRPEQVFDLEELSKDNVITELLRRIASLEYEVERLNNIINELEKFVDNYIIWGGGKNEGKVFKWTGGGYVEVYDFITDLSKKIQELKGSDKND